MTEGLRLAEERGGSVDGVRWAAGSLGVGGGGVTVTVTDDNGESPRGLSGPLPDRLAGGVNLPTSGRRN